MRKRQSRQRPDQRVRTKRIRSRQARRLENTRKGSAGTKPIRMARESRLDGSPPLTLFGGYYRNLTIQARASK